MELIQGNIYIYTLDHNNSVSSIHSMATVKISTMNLGSWGFPPNLDYARQAVWSHLCVLNFSCVVLQFFRGVLQCCFAVKLQIFFFWTTTLLRPTFNWHGGKEIMRTFLFWVNLSLENADFLRIALAIFHNLMYVRDERNVWMANMYNDGCRRGRREVVAERRNEGIEMEKRERS